MALTDLITKLQQNPDFVRNLCILAHVDHGKTTLSDSLLATNNIISHRMAGKVRYLDSREDEQLRGITMESSVISLLFRLAKSQDAGADVDEYLINLIDSPGHIDFSSEVSVASRLCDGALVLVDVVEGIQSQTVTVLRQCWNEKLKPILVLNKMDRLITELQMEPSEAFVHLKKLVEQANAVLGTFVAGERMLDAENETNNEDAMEKDLYFQPERNNVIFASAIDGWGFTVSQFASFYEKKLGFKKENLQKVLWGDFYLDPKTKKVLNSKNLKGRSLKPLFVSLILDNIWKIHKNTVTESRDPEVLDKIVKALGIKVLPRDLRSKDTRSLLKTVMSQWLPLSRSVLVTVAVLIPSPKTSQKVKIPAILDSVPQSELLSSNLRNAMTSCDASGSLCAYVSKMISVPNNELPENQRRSALTEQESQDLGRAAREKALKLAEQARKLEEDSKNRAETGKSAEIAVVSTDFDDFDTEYDDFDTDFDTGFDAELDDNLEDVPESTETLIGVARVYSGTLSKGMEIAVLGPKYDPRNPTEHVDYVTVESLYLLMGRDLVAVDTVPAGNIVGIGGLAGKILKNGTIFEKFNDDTLVGVNLAGLAGSSRPIVEVALEPVKPSQMARLENGLQLLVKSDPCAETYTNDSGEHVLLTSGELHLERCMKDLTERFAGIEIQASEPAVPFRETVSKIAAQGHKGSELENVGVQLLEAGGVSVRIRVSALDSEVVDVLTSSNVHDGNKLALHTRLMELMGNDCERIVALGPKNTGPNLLVDKSGALPALFENSKETLAFLTNGFQLAMNEGPLCHEPMQGVCVTVESYSETDNDGTRAVLITQFRDAIHKAFLQWSPRIMLAMYSCDIQASSEVLGKVYAVVQKRKGKIISEEMKEGTLLFNIEARIPVAEAFGFSDEFRKKTSGAAIPQLVFHGFETLDVDPFWVPSTQEELEALGTFAERENMARKYMNAVRRRKGLFVDEKVVEGADKQRNMKKD